MSAARFFTRRILAPVLLLALVAGAVYLEMHRSGIDKESLPSRKAPESSPYLLPSWLDSTQRKSAILHMRRIRSSVGAAADDVVALGRMLPADPGKRVEWLERIRPDLDLAVRSGNVSAAGAALQILRVSAEGRKHRTMEALTSPPFRALVAHAVGSSVPGVRIEAARLLPVLGGPGSRVEAIRLLSDSDARVRAEAARAYGALASPPGARRLAADYDAEKSAAVRTSILKALGARAALRGPAAFAVEKKALERGTTAEKLQALANLDLYRDHDVLTEILPLLGSSHPEVRRQSLRTIRILGSRKARAAVVKRTRIEPDPSIRKLAVETAKDLK